MSLGFNYFSRGRKVLADGSPKYRFAEGGEESRDISLEEANEMIREATKVEENKIESNMSEKREAKKGEGRTEKGKADRRRQSAIRKDDDYKNELLERGIESFEKNLKIPSFT